MNEKEFNFIISRLKDEFFLDILIALASFILLNQLIKYFRNTKIYISFIIYSLFLIYLFTFGSDICLSIIYSDDIIKKKTILETGNIAFAFVEAITFYFYFKNIISNKKINQLIKIAGITFLIFISCCVLSICYSTDKFKMVYKLSFIINTVEFFLIFIICLSYYYNIINIAHIKQAINLNELLITNSLFLYTSISLPFLSIGPTLTKLPKWSHDTLVILHYLSVLNIIVTLIFVQKKQNRITQWIPY